MAAAAKAGRIGAAEGPESGGGDRRGGGKLHWRTMATSTSPGASRTREGRLALYLRLARPFTLLPPMVGIVAGSLVAYGATHASWSWRVVLGAAAAAALLNAASNVLNQICDRAIDRRNKPWRPIPAGTVTTAEAARLSAALYAAALLVPALVGWQLFALYAAAAAATYLYSAPPLRTKRSPWGANLTIAAARGELLKVAGWAAVSSVTLSWEPWIIGAVFFLFLLGAPTTKDFADMAGDAAEGCHAAGGAGAAARGLGHRAVFLLAVDFADRRRQRRLAERQPERHRSAGGADADLGRLGRAAADSRSGEAGERRRKPSGVAADVLDDDDRALGAGGGVSGAALAAGAGGGRGDKLRLASLPAARPPLRTSVYAQSASLPAPRAVRFSPRSGVVTRYGPALRNFAGLPLDLGWLDSW